jgi:flagellar hook-basal body complex protein FliE
MPEPIQFQHLGGVGGIKPGGPSSAVPGQPGAPSSSFSETLLKSLDEVKRLQDEAAAGVKQILDGKGNPDEVFSAIRKADVAFSLLMEIRNKLTDAYEELKTMSV